MKKWVRACTLLAAAWLVGCASVTSSRPVGEALAPLSAGEWDGTWIGGEMAVTLVVEDPQKGQLRVFWAEAKREGPVLESYRVEVRRTGDWTFGNVADAESGGWFWALVAKREGQIVVLLPDADRIGALVESGALPGAKVEGSVRLGPLTADHVRRLVEDPSGVCPFDWREPLVLTRVGK
ncbi:MAG: hypothetical protein AB1347_11730 [Acidobacteriota bacterium]